MLSEVQKRFGFLILGFWLVACSTNQDATDGSALLLHVARGKIFGLFVDHTTYLIPANGTVHNSANLPTGFGLEPKWSPDGQWIAFVDEAHDDGTIIHLVSSDGTHRIDYQPSETANRDPAWSPDSTRLAYSGFFNRKPSILILNVECLLRGQTCQPKQTFLTEGDLPDWSPDGKQIAYMLIDDSLHSHVYVSDVEGNTKPVILTPNMQYCFRPRWSPNGKQIALSCSNAIYVVNADGSRLTKLTEPGTFPSWAPDGTKIAFVSSRDGLGKCIGGLCGSGGLYSNAVFLMNDDGSNVIRQSKRDDEEVVWYTWLPSQPAPAKP